MGTEPIKTEELINNGWFPKAATDAAASVDYLFYFILFLSVVCFIGIVGLMLFYILKYKRRSDDQIAESQMTHNTILEISWTVIPLILVTFIFAWGYLDFMKSTIPPVNAKEIRVTGKKWLWSFDYPQDGISTIGEIYVPVNTPIKLIMSSTDVLHSFYLPNFRIKRDTVPNRYTRLWFEANRTGTFQVFCTEYCGDGHSQMLADLHVLSEEDYADWVKSGGGSNDEMPLPELGEKLYTKFACNTCHSIDGSRVVGPTWKNLYGSDRKLADGSSVVADDDYIRTSIVYPAKQISAGYPPVMPAYPNLSDRDLNAIIEYIKTLK